MGRVYILAALLVVTPAALAAKACFPGNTWIKCLLNTCTIYKNCPGDPTATCKIKRTECGCEANWFKPSGQIANCDVRKNLQSCPGSQKTVKCKVDLCRWPCNHPDFVNAPCRQTNCGQCMAQYFVKEKWISCPNIVQRAAESEMLPIPLSQSETEVCKPVPCNIKICIDQKCPLAPRAVCRPDGCNKCKPAWYVGAIRVQCHAGGGPIVSSKETALIDPSACAHGETFVPCDRSICDKQICRNYPNAICSPDGCGHCKSSWHVDGKIVDCLSDECPPNVPFVKCIDDPCKYFSHYCPLAVCRASQCGKCEAKFFSNGVEVECTMPPKKCPATVKPLNCKWFTCPSNVCPSNKRLMCRIDPCGRSCRHDWVDVYNGEVMTCRIFDGDGRTIKDKKPEKIFMEDPLAKFFEKKDYNKYIGTDSNNLATPNTFPEPQHPVSVITGNAMPQHNQNRQGIQTKADVIVSRGPGRFRVEPLFVQPRQILSKADLYAMLNAFGHELLGISSLSIQNALRNKELEHASSSARASIPNTHIARLPTQQKGTLPKPQDIMSLRPSREDLTFLGPAVRAPINPFGHVSQFNPITVKRMGHVSQTNPITIKGIQTKPAMKPRFNFPVKEATMPISNPIQAFNDAQFMKEKSDKSENIKPQLMTADITLPVRADDVIANIKHTLPKVQTKRAQRPVNTASSNKPNPVWLLPVQSKPVLDQSDPQLTGLLPVQNTPVLDQPDPLLTGLLPVQNKPVQKQPDALLTGLLPVQNTPVLEHPDPQLTGLLPVPNKPILGHQDPQFTGLLPVQNTPVQEKPLSKLTPIQTQPAQPPPGPPSPIWLLPQGTGSDIGQTGTLGVMNEPPEMSGIGNMQPDTADKTVHTPLGTPSLILQQVPAGPRHMQSDPRPIQSDPRHIQSDPRHIQSDPKTMQSGISQPPVNEPIVQKKNLLVDHIAPKIQNKPVSKPAQNPQALGPKEDKGVPISLHMFQQWGA